LIIGRSNFAIVIEYAGNYEYGCGVGSDVECVVVISNAVTDLVKK